MQAHEPQREGDEKIPGRSQEKFFPSGSPEKKKVRKRIVEDATEKRAKKGFYPQGAQNLIKHAPGKSRKFPSEGGELLVTK